MSNLIWNVKDHQSNDVPVRAELVVRVRCPKCHQEVDCDVMSDPFETLYGEFGGGHGLAVGRNFYPSNIERGMAYHYSVAHRNTDEYGDDWPDDPPKIVRWDRYGDPIVTFD